MPRRHRNAGGIARKRAGKSKGRKVKAAPLSNFNGHCRKRVRPPR